MRAQWQQATGAAVSGGAVIRGRGWAWSGVVVAGVVLAGCSSGPTRESAASSSPGRELTVLAASSLRQTFTELAAQFQDAHPGAAVELSFAGSSDLVAQLRHGAPGDVLATADVASMDRAASDDLLAGVAQPFATNTMMIAVPADNPVGITSFADLGNKGTAVVVCAPQVPCGAATAEVESRSGVPLTPVSEENSVADVLGKVTSGQADAGVVYVTDVRAAGAAVTGVPIPPRANATNTYPIAVLAGSADPELAGQFRDLVLSRWGQEVLADAGFGVR